VNVDILAVLLTQAHLGLGALLGVVDCGELPGVHRVDRGLWPHDPDLAGGAPITLSGS